MKSLILSFLIIIGVACSTSFDGKTDAVELLKIEGAPFSISVPEGASKYYSSDVEDILGMYTLQTHKIKGAEGVPFNIEVTYTTLTDLSLEEAISEIATPIKSDDGFVRVVDSVANGCLYERKEINGELNYSFYKIQVDPAGYIAVRPEPKADGNTSLEEAQYMFNIVNR